MWKSGLICRTQLQSVVIKLCGWERFALSWCWAADWLSPTVDTHTHTHAVWLCFSNHMNTIQGYDGSAIFSTCKASRNGHTRRLIRVTEMLHEPDVWEENYRMNQHFVGGTQPCVCLGFWFKIRQNSFLLFSHLGEAAPLLPLQISWFHSIKYTGFF